MSSILDTLLEVFLQSTLLMIAVIGIRHFFKNRISPAALYACWGVVLLRLVFPVSIKSAFSFMNVVQPVTEHIKTAVIKTPQAAPINRIPAHITHAFPSVSASPVEPGPAASAGIDPASVIFFVWLVGVSLTLSYMLYVNLKFMRCVNKHKSAICVPKNLEYVFNGLRRRPPVYYCEGITAPCLTGVLRPVIHINESTLGNPQILRYVLIHELCHYWHKDHLWALLRNLALAAYWFHPLLWISAKLSKKDCERACDAAVLDKILENEWIDYGKSLIALISNRKTAFADISTTMGGSKKDIKERLKMIVKRPKMLKITALCLAVLMTALAAVACTGGITPDRTAVNSAIPTVSVSPSADTPKTADSGSTPSPSPEKEVSSSAIKTIYGVMPVDLVQSDLSKKYFPALVEAYRASETDPDNKTYGQADYPFKLFAVEPFEGGVLLLAGHVISQDVPGLYYMIGNKLISVTTDAVYSALTYTVFKNHTISYGVMLGDGDSNRSVKTVGKFADGEVIERSAKPIGNYQRGFILVANGQTWLSSIKFYDQNNKLVANEKSKDLWFSTDLWKGKATEVWGKQYYAQMLEKPVKQYDQYKLAIRYGKAKEDVAQMEFFVDDGSAGIQYVWRSQNNLLNCQDVKRSGMLKIDNLPANADIYWVDLNQDDGSDNDIQKLLVKGSLQAPDKTGSYCLIVKIDNLIYTSSVDVGK